MILLKKIHKLFFLVQNEWKYSPLSIQKKNQFLNIAFVGAETPRLSGNHYLLPFENLLGAGSGLVPENFKEFVKSPEPFILRVSQPINLTAEQLETCLNSFGTIHSRAVTLFVNTAISGENEVRLLDQLAHLLFQKVNQNDSGRETKFQLIIEMNNRNYLFADDFQLALSKWFSEKLVWVAHPEYYEKVSAARCEAHFQVRNFFDALSRNKSLPFPWRNYYHHFAMGELSADKALYAQYTLESANGIAKETRKRNSYKDGDANNRWLPNVLFNPFLMPPLGIQKLLAMSCKVIWHKLRSKSQAFRFDVLPHDGTKTSTGIQVKEWKKVLITGWYGTETQGDKAILGEVLYFIKSAAPECQIFLTTIHKGISEQTNKELAPLKGVIMVDLENANSPGLIREMDAVVVGGGPLMESASMKKLGYIFAEAYKQRKDRVIFGCGVGPIHSKEVESVTRYMLSVCQAGFLRDKESFEFASRLFPKHLLKFACDPAVGFVSRWRRNKGPRYNTEEKKSIATLLRANTNEFSPESDPSKLQAQNEALARKAARTLDLIAVKSNADFELLHMNAPWVGGDDRIYNRILAAQLGNKTSYHLVRDYLTLEEHMERLASCKAGLAMRYHGHIFCLAMGIPFVSLDYTGKTGKVSSLVNRIGYTNRSYQWDALEPEKLASDFADLLTNGKEISQYLLAEADKLVDLLNQTYIEVFNYCPEK